MALLLVLTLLFSTGCSSMTRSEKVAVGATVAIGAVITLLILGQRGNKHGHHRHHRGCGCGHGHGGHGNHR